ncbi:MAG: discoidin domain-containing protein [Dysgonamonadaceae bacterium]|jgi:hypothetical protein|nr:discoidin domain-containing protein [Dysgonamonadaceae bacterium]
MKSAKLNPFFIGFSILVMMTACNKSRQNPAQIGKYPGNPAESFAPELVTGNSDYRNVAELRAARHSSSYDYNLTAQLVTDGIIASEEPASIGLSTQDGAVEKRRREQLFDGKPDSRITVPGQDIFLQLDLNNMNIEIDRFVLKGYAILDYMKPKSYEIVAYGSNDGLEWTVLNQKKAFGLVGKDRPASKPSAPKSAMRSKTAQEEVKSPVIFMYDYQPKPEETPQNPSVSNAPQKKTIYRILAQEVVLKEPASYRHYKVEFKSPCAIEWNFTDWDFYRGETLLDMLPSFDFHSAWMSAGAGEEWVSVDFGAPASIDKVNLFWINKAIEGKIQASDDNKNWKDVASLPGGNQKNDEIKLDHKIKTQYLRLLMTKSENGNPYILSELQAFGKGGLTARQKAEPTPTEQRQTLSGGGWKLQRASQVSASGEQISSPDFKPENWLAATVPGTVLASYLNAGALPDPNFADNINYISESFFYSNFWYRNEFEVQNPGETTLLNFDGINWKADIFLNGQKIGNIDGAFMRGRFDVSKLVRQGKNVLAVEIIRPNHPGAVKEKTAWTSDQNGGILGADNPTFHASVGWDWIPTVRGRNIGIWNDVFLTFSGAVTIEDPFVRTELPLPDTTSASIFAEISLKNHSNKEVKGLLKGTYGETAFQREVSLAPQELQLVKFSPETDANLNIKNPKLWWPRGYGEPNLYNVSFSFETGGKVSDKTEFKSGVRQMTFDESVYQPVGGLAGGPYSTPGEQRRLSLYINGRRFVGFGGNWGFSESNLNYRGREYDIAVAYHADMNFTMIRNWVGQIGDEEFYEACDKYGLMIWQDFWLANPWDGPDPYYDDMFNANADDYVKRIRNHPSIGIYVGRNEGNPPADIDQHLRNAVATLHPGIHYISSSAGGVVSGGGPYRALPPKAYFKNYGHDKFHSERGMPNVMNYESMLLAFGKDAVEPVNTQDTPNNIYGFHDYTLGGPGASSAQSAASFNGIIEKAFGKPKDARQFAEWAQWVNYDGYRAMFEGRSEHRRGLLLWMSHPCWPSMVWQTYDYYFDPTAAYFGCKKASEPLHIQFNPIREDVEVVNYRAFDRKDLTAKAQIINQDGKTAWEKSISLDIAEDQTVACFPLEFPENLSSVYFIKLMLTDKDGAIVSDNFYWRGREEGNLKSLFELPKVRLAQRTSMKKNGGEWLLTTTLRNDTQTPALMIRLKLTGDGEERILPAFYSENYFFLMPGEEKTVTIRFSDSDARGERPEIVVSGFNV